MPSGTVLLSSRAPIGKVCITKAPMYCNQGFKNIICKELLYNEFAYYFLKHNVDYLQSLGTGATFKEISKKVVENVTIPVPPLSEQQHIVEELDLLSSIIENKKAQLKELDNLAQSLFYEMFGDPITNEKGWDVKKFGEIGKVITGSTPSTKDEENYNSCDYCFIKPSDIAKDNITRLFKSEFHISSKAYDNSRQLPKGSVLVTCIGIVGKVGILKVNATCNQQINAIVPYSFVQSQYLAYSILLQKKTIESIANAPVVPIINKKEFSILSTPIPPIDLQQQFVERVETIEHQKELIKKSIKEVETLFNSRMDYYFN
jgi:type I restriction enzyme S subunit